MRRVAGTALIAACLAAAACGSDTTSELNAGQSEATEPAQTVVPAALTVADGPEGLWPPDNSSTPVFLLSPASEDRFLLGAISTAAPDWGSALGWYLGSSDGAVQDIEPPPVDGVVQEGNLVSGDGQPIFASLICPTYEQLEEPAEPGTLCEGGYQGVTVLGFDTESLDWFDIAQLSPEELGIEAPERMTLAVVGAAGEHLYLAVGSGSFASDLLTVSLETGDVRHLTSIEAGTYLRCVTAQEQVVALFDDPIVSEDVIDFETDEDPYPPKLAWSTDGGPFIPVADAPGGVVGCATSAAAAVGSQSPLDAAMQLEWIEVDLESGEVISSVALPSAMQPSDPTEVVTVDIVGGGTESLGVVVGSTQLGTESSGVAVLPDLNSEPLTHDLDSTSAATVQASAKLGSGQIVILTAETMASAGRVKLLLAR